MKNGIDLIVIATHGYTGLKLMLGSVALSILRRLPDQGLSLIRIRASLKPKDLPPSFRPIFQLRVLTAFIYASNPLIKMSL